MAARFFRVGRTLFATAFAEFAEYRAEIAIWILSGSMPLIMMLIWMGLAAGGTMGGYSAQDFAAYFLIVFLVRQMTPVWVVDTLDREIRMGELSPKLLRPLDPFWVPATQHLCGSAMHVTVALPFVVLGFWISGAAFAFDPGAIAAFLLAVAGAWLVRFNMLYGLGLLAFWTDQVNALGSLMFTVFMVLGGGLVPLDLFPPGIRAALDWLPFRYMLDFPVQVLLGRIAGLELLQGFAVQAVWAALFIALQRLLWRRGLRRYGAVGA